MFIRLVTVAVLTATAAMLAMPATGDAAVAARPRQCGGFTGGGCAKGQWCEFPQGRCNWADIFGQCRTVPQVCAYIYRPVCGCDGKTYSNDCTRRRHRVSKLHDGKCRR